MKSIEKMSLNEKINFINFLEERADGYFNDFSNEITRLLSDEKPQIRIKAIDLLWDNPCTKYLQWLFKLAECDPAPEVRARAINGLGRYIYEGIEFSFDNTVMDNEFAEPWNTSFTEVVSNEEYTRVKQFLFRIYRNRAKPVIERCYALEALSYSVEDEIQEIIREAYNSTQQQMKQSALFSMGRNGLLCWKNIIMTELESQDEIIVQEAVKAAGEMALMEAGKKILNLTYAGNPELAKAAIRTLGKMGWQGAFERLDELSRIRNKEMRQLAEAALEEWYLVTSSMEEEEEFLP